jgi:hypothetical protein
MHRLGLALSAIPVVTIASASTRDLYQFGRLDSLVIEQALSCLGVATILYAACWALGWVIAGFMGDEG